MGPWTARGEVERPSHTCVTIGRVGFHMRRPSHHGDQSLLRIARVCMAAAADRHVHSTVVQASSTCRNSWNCKRRGPHPLLRLPNIALEPWVSGMLTTGHEALEGPLWLQKAAEWRAFSGDRLYSSERKGYSHSADVLQHRSTAGPSPGRGSGWPAGMGRAL